MSSATLTLSNLGDELEIRIKQGATWDGGEFELVYEDENGDPSDPVDLTGAVITMHFRRKGLDRRCTGCPTARLRRSPARRCRCRLGSLRCLVSCR